MSERRHRQDIRIFLSSPGDVAEERRLARELIEGALRKDPAYRDRLSIRVRGVGRSRGVNTYAREQVPQASVIEAKPPPSQCDIVVVILWSRLGSPFEIGGRRWASGTEWEYEDAANAPSKPDILVYRCTAEPPARVDFRDPKLLGRDDRVASAVPSARSVPRPHLALQQVRQPCRFRRTARAGPARAPRSSSSQATGTVATTSPFASDLLARFGVAQAAPPAFRAGTEQFVASYLGTRREAGPLRRPRPDAGPPRPLARRPGRAAPAPAPCPGRPRQERARRALARARRRALPLGLSAGQRPLRHQPCRAVPPRPCRAAGRAARRRAASRRPPTRSNTTRVSPSTSSAASASWTSPCSSSSTASTRRPVGNSTPPSCRTSRTPSSASSSRRVCRRGDRGAEGWLGRLRWDQLGPTPGPIEVTPLDVAGIADVLRSMGDALAGLAGDPEVTEQLAGSPAATPCSCGSTPRTCRSAATGAGRLRPEDLAKLKPGFGPFFRGWLADQESALEGERTAGRPGYGRPRAVAARLRARPAYATPISPTSAGACAARPSSCRAAPSRRWSGSSSATAPSKATCSPTRSSPTTCGRTTSPIRRSSRRRERRSSVGTRHLGAPQRGQAPPRGVPALPAAVPRPASRGGRRASRPLHGPRRGGLAARLGGLRRRLPRVLAGRPQGSGCRRAAER